MQLNPENGERQNDEVPDDLLRSMDAVSAPSPATNHVSKVDDQADLAPKASSEPVNKGASPLPLRPFNLTSQQMANEAIDEEEDEDDGEGDSAQNWSKKSCHKKRAAVTEPQAHGRLNRH